MRCAPIRVEHTLSSFSSSCRHSPPRPSALSEGGREGGREGGKEGGREGGRGRERGREGEDDSDEVTRRDVGSHDRKGEDEITQSDEVSHDTTPSGAHPASDLPHEVVEGVVHSLPCLRRGLNVAHVMVLGVGLG